MSSETSIERQQIYPILTYADAPAAIEFLCRAFGFEELSVLRVPDGRVAHALLSLHGLQVMLSSEFEQLDNRAPGGGDSNRPGFTSTYPMSRRISAGSWPKRDRGAGT